MRSFLVLALLAACPMYAEVRFISPVDGAQVYGRVLLEVTTTTPDVNRVEFFVDGNLAGVVRTAPYRMVYDFGESLAAHQILARVSSDQYRRHETATVTTAALGASETLDVDLVEVPFKALSRKPRLGKSDIQIRESGVPQEVREVLSTRGPTSFYFVIDRSLSMREGKLQKALSAVDGALDKLRPDDDATLILFNHRVDAPRTLNRSADLVALLGDIPPSGGTSMRDALASIQPKRRTIAIVISDGADRNSSLSTAAALQKVGRSKTTVYALILGGGAGADFLEVAAGRSGGSSRRTTAEKLPRDLAAVMDDINSRYIAIYQSRGTGKGWREIQLLSRGSAVRITSSRRGYYAE